VPILLDLNPLRVSPAYGRLFTGFTLAGVGSQLSVVAIGLQVYQLTGSSFSVGPVGPFALVPIIMMGLYVGALIDAHDRRTVALVASAVMWTSGILTARQAWLGNTNPLVLYVLVAVISAGFAVVSPARSASHPRLLEHHLLPAANALGVFAVNVALSVGPLLAGFLVDWGVTSWPTPWTSPCSPRRCGACCGCPRSRRSRTRRGCRGAVSGLRACSMGCGSWRLAPTCG
jgi:MFS family permease